MRLIGTLYTTQEAESFSQFLKSKGISHQMETHQNSDWGSPQYGNIETHIWINDEDQLEAAIEWLRLFQNDPDQPFFAYSTSPSPLSLTEEYIKTGSKGKKNKIAWDKQPLGWITRMLLAACTLLLVFSDLLAPKISTQVNPNLLSIYTSPIDKALLYDYPLRYELIDRFIRLYGVDDVKAKDIPSEGKVLLNTIKETPIWQGLYETFISGADNQAPLFEKIRQGQMWRLFTPALLHADIFHLFFNMLWLIVLGKQIEQHLSASRYILFLLIVGVFSNTLQYLSSGPNFVGFSGILCGMLTFIWARQTHAPWEGYQLNRMTYLFMMIFIVGMALTQLLSFLAEKFFGWNIAINIANTAHLSGAFIGYLLGRMNIFSWRHS